MPWQNQADPQSLNDSWAKNRTNEMEMRKWQELYVLH